MKRLLGWGMAALVLAGTATGAEAAQCQASTLEGTWAAVASVAKTFVGACHITVADDGTITSGNCISLIPPLDLSVKGALSVRPNCRVTAKMSFTNGVWTSKRTFTGKMSKDGIWVIDLEAADGSHARLLKQSRQTR